MDVGGTQLSPSHTLSQGPSDTGRWPQKMERSLQRGDPAWQRQRLGRAAPGHCLTYSSGLSGLAGTEGPGKRTLQEDGLAGRAALGEGQRPLRGDS